MSVVINVENVSKTFKFWTEETRSLKGFLIKAGKGNFTLGKMHSFCALKNVDFQINEGEFVGIMGRNGAGKSTLLKLLAGIYTPTSGSIKVHRKLAPLIELGAGFHGDLSGEENVFLNAAILGFGRKAANEALPSILEFSELGDLIKMPVRTYSSGMVVRLGFSVAIHFDAPILLLDEVLAVGDAGFQDKCLKKIIQLHREGRTIIFITHDSTTVEMLCSRCILLHHHEKIYDGLPQGGVNLYRQLVKSKLDDEAAV